MKRALGLTHLALSQSRVLAVRVRVVRVRVWRQAVWKGCYSLSNVGMPLRRVVTFTASCSFPAHFPYCSVRVRGRVRPACAALDARPVLQPSTVMLAHRARLQNWSVAEPVLRAHSAHCVRAQNGRIKPEEALLRGPFPAPIASQSEQGRTHQRTRRTCASFRSAGGGQRALRTHVRTPQNCV